MVSSHYNADARLPQPDHRTEARPLREALQLGSGDALYFAKALQLIEHDELKQRRVTDQEAAKLAQTQHSCHQPQTRQ